MAKTVSKKKKPSRRAPIKSGPAPASVTKDQPPKPSGPKPVYDKVRLPETDQGTVVFRTDPLIVKDHYEIDYIHSYCEDSPFFRGLAEGKLLGSECTGCGYRYATPRAYCMQCGAPTKWIELPKVGRVHT